MTQLVFYSITGQTRRFISKLDLPENQVIEITDDNPLINMTEDYILLVPAYEDDMMDSVIDFLNFENNSANCIGVAGSGNRNFNTLYNQTARKIAQGLELPVIFEYEFNGTEKDVNNFKKVVQEFGTKHTRS
ncbi:MULTISPECIES: class Ib ribonucleoside-diphosphate reductase assembly flavoprotein NrdI [Lactobacillaceae]|uniref:class Ib ribonucleoside-diphosphate reductase assembly flavoprotein NrdI n=1 Tax=Lactobacillaceae TaxID=33958 RepID=UPI000C1B6B2E|nr:MULTISPECIES: class Ib ribonucleoside-diphosphate reductase assembly flavoprotein NrdI [Lactobacillaceae]